MAYITFESTYMKNVGKYGILVPDDTGYITACIGGYNTHSVQGDYYPAEDVIAIYEASSVFQRRIRGGRCYGENGHPGYDSSMTETQYYNRLLEVKEERTCCHWRKIYLDLDFGRKHPDLNNQHIIGVFGEVAPAGELGYVLREKIESKDQNLAFSIRAFSDNVRTRNGTYIRTIRNPVTYDLVNEGGITFAEKDRSPTLLSSTPMGTDGGKDFDTIKLIDKVIDVDILKTALSDEMTRGVSLESGQRELYASVLEMVSKTDRKIKQDRKIFLL